MNVVHIGLRIEVGKVEVLVAIKSAQQIWPNVFLNTAGRQIRANQKDEY
jgi:hypothetical protein